MLPTIEWKDDAVVMIDQRKLPASEVYVTCKTAKEVAKAIKTMVIRGAPAIGVAAAMGIALGMRRSSATGTKQFTTEFQKLCDLMAATRPTAVNLFWAIERMKRTFAAAAQGGASVDEIKQRLEAEAQQIHDEDVASCRAMGAHGATLVPDEAQHPHALQRRRAGDGGLRHGARRDPRGVGAGKKIAVLADETRPFLQGARLTAWELVKDGIDTTVITDNMAASMMRLGHVDLVVVGADRIAANGDVANKIGTYGVAVLAKEHGIPFYVAAPLSTVDLNTPDGSGIPIEERNDREVTHVGSSRLTPEGARIRNPAFDVTPSKYVTRDHHRARASRGRPTHESLAGVWRADVRVRNQMIVLGIETSCDETAAALVEETGDAAVPWRLRSSVVASQVAIHREWGGVVPELSARQHIRDICGVVERALLDGGQRALRRDRGDAGPRPRRLAARGRVVRKVAGLGAQRPARPRSSSGGPHRVARARQRRDAVACRRARSSRADTPACILSARQARTELLGRTRDDAAGEAYDKVAKLLGLGYPGRAGHRSPGRRRQRPRGAAFRKRG